jgi:hypothetical protein
MSSGRDVGLKRPNLRPKPVNVQCRWYYTYAEDTVEEAIAARVVTRMASMDGMAGDDTAMLDEIARIIEAAARC